MYLYSPIMEQCTSLSPTKNNYLTPCILVGSSTVICWMSPLVILGVSGLFFHFYSIFDGKYC